MVLGETPFYEKLTRSPSPGMWVKTQASLVSSEEVGSSRSIFIPSSYLYLRHKTERIAERRITLLTNTVEAFKKKAGPAGAGIGLLASKALSFLFRTALVTLSCNG